MEQGFGAGIGHLDPQIKAPISPQDAPLTIDPRMAGHDSIPKRSSPVHSHINFESFNASPAPMESFNDFLPFGAELTHHEPAYPWVWPEFIDPVSGSNLDKATSTPPSTHTRCTSIMSQYELEPAIAQTKPASLPNGQIPEYDGVMNGDNAWPLARCNPVAYSGGCPRTAILHLESLEEKSKLTGTWDTLGISLEKGQENDTELASVVPMSLRTRDRVLAITQTFLQKALSIHRYGYYDHNKSSANSRQLPFVGLPPSEILDYFLKNYVRNLSFYYSLVSTSCLDPNELIEHNETATLLILLMIAQGASAVPREGARSLSTGLIETCRISLFDIIEKNVEMCADSTVHRCALLFTLLGAWSGDKWLMDIAMGQRGMYLEMLKHAGMFESRPAPVPPIKQSMNIEVEWRSWVERETKNRLVYNWVMVDQEISLFHDTGPLLAISDLRAPLPGPEQLWVSGDANQWMATMQSPFNYSTIPDAQLVPPPPLTPSLYELYQQFVHDNTEGNAMASLTPYQLRLLLHPLQTFLWHLREMTFYSSDPSNMANVASPPAIETPTLFRKEEVQRLLQKWQRLAHAHLQSNPSCVTSMTNMVLFHLISLNSVTNFTAIEQLARGNGSVEQRLQISHYIQHTGEATYHCGQVIRLVRAMPTDRRPVWWSAAIYRAMLILWAYSILTRDSNIQFYLESETPVVIDQLTLEAQPLYDYMWSGKGTPVLSGPNASTVRIDKPSDVIDYAIGLLKGGISTRFGDGLRRKLITLKQRCNEQFRHRQTLIKSSVA
ncbi:hypothetical protein ONZ43_g516 [Nemania bipapillata]|uniref:Uncharacterized protein n=1 Tax=Nemania bipapillata TaxID=110536 RepID=A0ACC2J829_9PEZI|nr:hypothetical protein ONZ43_g516 [Nemania bipapillata]